LRGDARCRGVLAELWPPDSWLLVQSFIGQEQDLFLKMAQYKMKNPHLGKVLRRMYLIGLPSQMAGPQGWSCFFFLDSVSLCSPGWPQTSLHLKCWITGVHSIQLHKIVLTCKIQWPRKPLANYKALHKLFYKSQWFNTNQFPLSNSLAMCQRNFLGVFLCVIFKWKSPVFPN
jgi:hypothetical protein